jgi:hypothetical protein
MREELKNRLKAKFPQLSDTSSPKEMMDAFGAYELIVAAKKPDGTWAFHATGASKDPDAMKKAIAEVILAIASPE